MTGSSTMFGNHQPRNRADVRCVKTASGGSVMATAAQTVARSSTSSLAIETPLTGWAYSAFRAAAVVPWWPASR